MQRPGSAPGRTTPALGLLVLAGLAVFESAGFGPRCHRRPARDEAGVVVERGRNSLRTAVLVLGKNRKLSPLPFDDDIGLSRERIAMGEGITTRLRGGVKGEKRQISDQQSNAENQGEDENFGAGALMEKIMKAGGGEDVDPAEIGEVDFFAPMRSGAESKRGKVSRSDDGDLTEKDRALLKQFVDEQGGTFDSCDDNIEESDKRNVDPRQLFNFSRYEELLEPAAITELSPPGKVDFKEFHANMKDLRLDADIAINMMWEAMKNETERVKRYWKEEDELVRRGMPREPMCESVYQPDRPVEFDAEETKQVNEIFDGDEFICYLKSPLIQLGFMRLPFCISDETTYDDISYNDLEEYALRLERFKDELKGTGGPREITDADEENMKRGMRVVISRFRKGKIWQMRQKLKAERLRIIDKICSKLRRTEQTAELTRQRIAAIPDDTDDLEAAVNNMKEDEGDTEEKIRKTALKPLRNNDTEVKRRLTQSVLNFFRNDEDLGIGTKTVSRICQNAMDPKKNEVRTMGTLLKKIHKYPYGLSNALEYFILRHLSENQNGLRAQRYILEELKWFYEIDYF